MPLNFKKSGAGPPLVLVHGLFGSLENLGGIARLLQEQFTVYSVDLPNHGRSPHVEPTSLEFMANDLHEWLDEQEIEKAHVLGHSLGGKVGMELALTQEERVDHLIVLDIAPIRYKPHHQTIFAGLLAIDPGALTSRGEADKILQDYETEPAIRSFLLKNLSKSNKGYEWRMNLQALHDDYEELVKNNFDDARFNGPTLFIKGGNSPYISEDHREEILGRFPRAHLKIVANTGHWLHAEKPEVVAKLVANFLVGK